MAYFTDQEIIEYKKQFLKDHPIDPAFDYVEDLFDGSIEEYYQIEARAYYKDLKELGEIE